MKKLAFIGAAVLAVGSMAMAQEGGFTYTPNRILYPGPGAPAPNVLQSNESCVFDPERNLILVINGGPGGAGVSNGFVTLVNPDGTVHTPRWIDGTTEGVALVSTFGGAISNGVLYIVDSVGGTTGQVIRTFNLATGAPLATIPVPGTTFLNGIAVAEDGTIYVSNSSGNQRIMKITPAGEISVLVQGNIQGQPALANPTINTPNGVAMDADGNIVVVNINDNRVQTFNPAGELIRTEMAVQQGNDGLVVLANGVKYVNKVTAPGSVSVIRPGQPAQEIGTGADVQGASACYDSIQHQLVIPVNANPGGLIFIPLDPADKPAAATAAAQEVGFTYTANRILYPGPGAPAPNVLQSSESCTFDPERNLILVLNGGPASNTVSNGWVTLINPDGTVHTPRWLDGATEGVVIRNTLGSAIRNGILYITDNGTGNTVRMFDLATGAPRGFVPSPAGLNGLAVAADGTIYGSAGETIHRIAPDGTASIFVTGAPLNIPNGVAIDPQGNIVVVNIADTRVLTFNPAGELIRTDNAVRFGNDGLVVLSNGVIITNKVSPTRDTNTGSVSVIVPGQPAVEIIDGNDVLGASACYDSIQHQLVIPVNANPGGLIFIPLDPAYKPAAATSGSTAAPAQ